MLCLINDISNIVIHMLVDVTMFKRKIGSIVFLMKKNGIDCNLSKQTKTPDLQKSKKG